MMSRLLIVQVLLLLMPQVFFAQKKKDPIPAPVVSPDSSFKAIKWRNIGPFRGGRSNAVAGIRGNSQLYYAGYTGGGVWRTDDGGLNWRNISDGQFDVGSIGDIAVAASDQNILYVGSGEHAVRGVMTSYGDGVYKSTDAGRTWKKTGLDKTRHISDVIIHPANPDLVYVAAQGPVHGNSPDRGVYRTTDGGVTWKKILFVNDSTGVSSLSMDPNNPRVLYAATWQHRRFPWTVSSGGPGSAIWKSTDGGESWNKLSGGLPAMMGKVGIAVSGANSNRVFAIVETEKSTSGLYRSDDAGRTWSLLSNNQDISSRSWYYMEVFADPKNDNIVYVLNAPMMRSIDGGRTFQQIRVGHGDTHDLWINPDQPDNMILGDDGGAEITFNGGRSWSTQMNQPTAQFYRVQVDNQFPFRIYGGQQDNTSVIIASNTNGQGISERDWQAGAGCECAYQAFDPDHPTLVYGGCYQGYIEVLNMETGETKDVQAYPALNLANNPSTMKYRFNWNAPIVASPHDAKTIYHAANVLLRTTDGGIRWEAISSDLTRNDKAKQGPGGGPMTNEGAGGENYNTIYYVIESPREKGVIWTGSDCGLVHVTRDGGKTWTNVTPAGLPEGLINSIELSPHDNGTAYVSATAYKFNDFGSYTYRTTDYGKTWKRISSGVEADDFIRVIREDRKRKGLLYAGGERYFYISYDGGTLWQRMQLNFPVVPVTDLAIKDNSLVAATAGRAFWIMDDLGIFQQLSPAEAMQPGLRMLAAQPAVRFGGGSGLPSGIPSRGLGENAPTGVTLEYLLPELREQDTLTLDILDAQGKVVRTYTNKRNAEYSSYPGGPPPATLLPSAKGLNRFLWDFRAEQVKPDVKGVFVYGDYRGARVAPGNYRARMTLGSQVSETPLTVLQDPRMKSTPAQWQEQQQMITQVNQRISDIHQQVNDLRKVTKQLDFHESMLRDKPDAKAVADSGKALRKRITDWESNVVESRIQNGQDVINWPSRLNVEYFLLKSQLDAQDPQVTAGIRDRLKDLDAEWAARRRELDAIRQQIDAYNRMYQSKSYPALDYK
jgi:photosystem II stability/assembly factor-like uncharacterized protein